MGESRKKVTIYLSKPSNPQLRITLSCPQGVAYFQVIPSASRQAPKILGANVSTPTILSTISFAFDKYICRKHWTIVSTSSK